MTRNFIDGRWADARRERVQERCNPADTRQIVTTAPLSTQDDVADAVSAVVDGYRKWASTSPEARADVLARAAVILERDPDGLAAALVAEEGKTLAEARMEVSRTPANLRYYASEAVRTMGSTYPTVGSGLVFGKRQPVGVVGAITPWNFPLNIPSRKLGPALATGNGVVFKPSELTPLLGSRLVEVLLEAGVPAGALALVHGDGQAGAAVASDPRVDAVTFTGSTAAGAAIHATTGPARRVQLEMGGNNPVLVDADADLERAAEIIARGAFGLTGQACTGTSRVIAHESVHDALLERVVARAEALRIGDGAESGVQMGPLASAAQRENVEEYLRIGSDEGVTLCTGAKALPEAEFQYGHFIRPAVFADVKPESRIAREEIFGPVVVFLRSGSFDESVRLCNDTEYGLSASIVTNDIGRALEFAERVDAGLVKINQPTTGQAMNAPFGGVKNSSTQTSKEQAGEAMNRFYTVDKTVYIGQ